MTMPSSGPISIGQARNEMNQGNPINAGNGALSQLAGVSAGQRYAWSYWRGKSKPIVNQLMISVDYGVNRNLWIVYNIRTGVFDRRTDGDGRTRATLAANYIGALPNIGNYGSVSVAIGENRNTNSNSGGSWRPARSISQQPNAGNDWTFEAYLDDNPTGDAAYGQMDFHLYAS